MPVNGPLFSDNLVKIFLKNKTKIQGLFFVYFIFLSFPNFSLAKKERVWIRSLGMSLNSFQIELEALGPSHISYAQSLLLEARKRADFFKLQDKLIVAQDLYLSGEETQAIEAFRKITLLALSADWDEEDRRIILYSFLRQAQLEKNKDKKQALLLSAVEFALFKINDKNYSDYRLFPPPFMEQLEDIQSNSNDITINWKRFFPDHEIVLINGKQISTEEPLVIPKGSYRISVFSSSHSSWSKNINLADLFTMRLKFKALTKGFCEKAKIRRKLNRDRVYLLPAENCSTSPFLAKKSDFTSNHVTEKTKALEDFFENNETFNISEKDIFSVFDGDPVEMNFEIKENEEFSDLKPWLIAGGGLVVITVILSLGSQKGNKKESHVY